MARTETTNLKLGMWTDGENPGAGTQNQSAIGTGLNDNWKIIDNTMGAGHNPDGSHKTAIIDGPNLKSTAVDGVTIVQDGVTRKLRVPDGGIGAAQLAVASVSAATLGASAVTTPNIAAGAVTGNEIAIAAVGTAHLTDGAVTPVKIQDGAVDMSKLDSGVKIMTGVTLYANATEAGGNPGQAPSPGTEWQETANYDVIKVRCWFYKQTGMKTLRLYGKGRTSDPMQAWTVTMLAADTAGSVLASAATSGVNVMYGSNAEVGIAIDISGLAAGAMYEVYVKLRTGGNGATALMKQLQVVVTA